METIEIKKEIEAAIESYLNECTEKEFGHAAVQMAVREYTIEEDEYSAEIYGELIYTEVSDQDGSDEYDNYEDRSYFEWTLYCAYALVVTNDNGERVKIELDDLEGRFSQWRAC